MVYVGVYHGALSEDPPEVDHALDVSNLVDLLHDRLAGMKEGILDSLTLESIVNKVFHEGFYTYVVGMVG